MHTSTSHAKPRYPSWVDGHTPYGLCPPPHHGYGWQAGRLRILAHPPDWACLPDEQAIMLSWSATAGKRMESLEQLMSSTPLHDPLQPPVPDATTETRTTTCYMCACRCGIRVHLRNGEVRYIDGNPDHPLTGGVICAKGSSGIMQQDSPARRTKTLRRQQGAERGAPADQMVALLQLAQQCRRHRGHGAPRP